MLVSSYGSLTAAPRVHRVALGTVECARIDFTSRSLTLSVPPSLPPFSAFTVYFTTTPLSFSSHTFPVLQKHKNQ